MPQSDVCRVLWEVSGVWQLSGPARLSDDYKMRCSVANLR